MRSLSLLVIPLLAFAATPGEDWHIWTPRDEIAPRHSQLSGDAELVLEGAGNPVVFGGWERVYTGVTAGQWYGLQLRFTATGIDHELLQLPVRMDWVDTRGQRIGEPDYAYLISKGSPAPWRNLTMDAPAPDGATAVKVQLLLQNAPRAKVRWRDVAFTRAPAPQPRKVTVATVRLRPSGPDPVSRFIETANARVAAGTDLIVLPEGITVVGTGKKYADVAEPVPGPTTKRLGEIARAKRAWVVAGLLERDGGAIYNTAVLIDRAGNFAGKYHKIYIPREELEGGITPGSDFPVFQTDFGQVGMMICWDLQYTDPARGLALRGAELILMPIWGGNEILAKARAIENHVFLASSGYDFPSEILDPVGGTLARTEDNGTVATATIDLNRRYLEPYVGHMRGRFFRELRTDLKTNP